MQKEKMIREGTVIDTLPNTMFRVKMDSGNEVIAHLSGKMRIHFIKIIPGDRVRIEMGPYNETRGRIVYRMK